MLTIKSKAPIKKEIDYNILSENYNKVDFDNNYLQRVKSLTINDIRDFAKKILQPNNRIEITMKSK